MSEPTPSELMAAMRRIENAVHDLTDTILASKVKFTPPKDHGPKRKYTPRRDTAKYQHIKNWARDRFIIDPMATEKYSTLQLAMMFCDHYEKQWCRESRPVWYELCTSKDQSVSKGALRINLDGFSKDLKFLSEGIFNRTILIEHEGTPDARRVRGYGGFRYKPDEEFWTESELAEINRILRNRASIS